MGEAQDEEQRCCGELHVGQLYGLTFLVCNCKRSLIWKEKYVVPKSQNGCFMSFPSHILPLQMTSTRVDYDDLDIGHGG